MDYSYLTFGSQLIIHSNNSLINQKIFENDNLMDLKEYPHSFFPQFSYPDQLWGEFYQAKLCDRYAKGTEVIRTYRIPPIPAGTEEGKKIIKRIRESHEKKYVSKISKINILGPPLAHCQITIIPKELIKGVFNSAKSYNEIRQDQKSPPIRIKECFQIGSSTIPILGTDYYLYAVTYLFADQFSIRVIKGWFLSMDHLKENVNPKVNDIDFRIQFSEDDLQFGCYASNQLLHNVSLQIPKKVNLLFKKHYSNHLRKGHTTQESYLLASPAIRNRNVINLGKTRYTIIAFNKIDMSLVGSDSEQNPTLENLNLSSRRCIGISQSPFLKDTLDETEEIELMAEPFGVQAILDFLFDCATPTTYNLDGWRHYLRVCVRMMHPHDELKMVHYLFEKKKIFDLQAETIFEISDWRALSLEQAIAYTTEGYLYLVLQKDFAKIEKDERNPLNNPYYLSSYLFRACQSLSIDSRFSDTDAEKLWNLIDRLHWNNHALISSPQMIDEEIKRVLVNDKVPFSVLSAWMGLLVWIWNPLSATIHCDEPVFHIKIPFNCILPINPATHCSIVHEYFAAHPFPQSLQNIYKIFADTHQSSLRNFPLLPYFSKLNINPYYFKNLTDQWIKHPIPLLNTLGIELYLSFYSLIPDTYFLVHSLQNLPFLLHATVHQQQQNEIMHALDSILITHSLKSTPWMKPLMDQRILTINQHQWMQTLMRSNHPDLVYLAFTLWKGEKKHLKDKDWEILGWELFKALAPYHFHLSVTVFKTLPPLSIQESLHEFHFLIATYLAHPIKDIHALGSLVSLLVPIFDADYKINFNKAEQQMEFSESIGAIIPILFNHARYQIYGMRFLLKSSSLGLLGKEKKKAAWKKVIEQLISQNEKECLAATLFQIAINNKWISLQDLAADFPVKLKIQLGEALLKQKHSSLSFHLLRKYSQQVFQHEDSYSVYQWILHYLEINGFENIGENDTEVLNLFLNIIPRQNNFQTHVILNARFIEFLAALESSPIRKNFLLIFLDKFFAEEKMRSIMNSACIDWKNNLLNYITLTVSFDIEKRLDGLWNLFQRIVSLINTDQKNKARQGIDKKNPIRAKEEQLPLYDLLTLLLYQTSILKSKVLPKKILEWIKSYGEQILEQLFLHQHIDEGEILLLTMHDYRYHCEASSTYIGRICRHQFKRGNCSKKILNLIDEKQFEILAHSATLEDAPFLLWLIENKFNHFPDHFLKALNGIQCYLKLCKKEENPFPMDLSKDLFLHLQKKIYLILNTPDLSMKNLTLVMELMEFPSLNSLSNSVLLWKRLDQDSFGPEWTALIEYTWNQYKNRNGTFLENGESGSTCMLYILKCLNKIKHPDLLLYLDQDQWELTFMASPTTLKLLNTALSSIFLGVISRMNPENFDEELFDKIWTKKKFYSNEKYFYGTRKEKLKSMERWNCEIEIALFKSLGPFTQLLPAQVVKKFSIALNAHFNLLLLARTDKNTFIRAIHHLFESYLSLHAKNMFSAGEEECIRSSLSSLFSCMPILEQFNGEELVKLLSNIPINSLIQHQSLIIPLILSLVKKGHTNEISLFKPLIFSILTHCLSLKNATFKAIKVKDDADSSNEAFDKIIDSNYLQVALRKLNFSTKQKTSLQYLYFAYQFQLLLSSHPLEDPLFDQLIDLYNTYIPQLFSERTLIKEAINIIIPLLIHYAQVEMPHEHLSEKFELCLFKLFETKTRISLKDNPSQEALNNYYQMILTAIDQYPDIDHFRFAHTLFRYLNTTIEQIRNPLPPHETQLVYGQVIEKMEAIIYFCPPFPLFYFAPKTSQLNREIKHVLQIAEEKNLFFHEKSKLILLKFWVNENITIQSDDHLSGIIAKNWELALQSIDQHLSFAPPSLYILQKTLYLLKAIIDFVPTNQFIVRLFPYYKKILDLMLPNKNLMHLFINEASASTPFSMIIGFSIDKLKNKKGVHPIVRSLSSLFYSYAFRFVTEIANEEKFSQGHYLHCCVRLLFAHSLSEGVQEDPQFYLKKIYALVPLIRQTTITCYSSSFTRAPLPQSDLTALIRIFVKTIINISEDSNQIKPLIVLDWLSSLCTIEPQDHLESLCDALLISLVEIISKGLMKPFWIQVIKKEFNLKIKIIESIILANGTESQKIYFLLIKLQWTQEWKKKDQNSFYESLETVISSLPKISGLSESIAILNITYYYVLIAPIEKGIIPTPLLLQKSQRLLNEYLTHLILLVEHSPPDSDEKFKKSFLAYFTLKGFEATQFDENIPIHCTYLDWVRPFIADFFETEPALKLRFLIYDFSKGKKSNIETFVKEIQDLIPELSHYVCQTKRFNESFHLICLIRSIYDTHNSESLELFTRFFFSFSDCKIPKDDQEAFYKHATDIVGFYKQDLPIQIKMCPLQLYFYSSEDLTIKNYMNDKKVIQKKLFTRYFKDKKNNFNNSKIISHEEANKRNTQ